MIDVFENVTELCSGRWPLRLVVIVSAWDRVDGELTPYQWLAARVPGLLGTLESNPEIAQLRSVRRVGAGRIARGARGAAREGRGLRPRPRHRPLRRAGLARRAGALGNLRRVSVAHQLLFGYDDGHRLLAGSRELPAQTLLALLGASDAAMEAQSAPLLTGVALPDSPRVRVLRDLARPGDAARRRGVGARSDRRRRRPRRRRPPRGPACAPATARRPARGPVRLQRPGPARPRRLADARATRAARPRPRRPRADRACHIRITRAHRLHPRRHALRDPRGARSLGRAVARSCAASSPSAPARWSAKSVPTST